MDDAPTDPAAGPPQLRGAAVAVAPAPAPGAAPSPTRSAPEPAPTEPLVPRLAWAATGLAVLAAWLGFGLLNLGFADPLPFSDEAAHLQKVLDLDAQLADAPSAAARLHDLLFSRDSYPHLVHLVARAALPWGRELAVVRASMLAFGALHLLVAFVVGPRVLGRAGTLAYVALVGLHPLLSAWHRVFLIDVPLTHLVGVALLLLYASEGFRRAAPSAGFALAAALGMATKWVWAVFLGAPALLVGLAAVGASAARTGRRVFVGLGLAAVAAAGAGGVWALGNGALGGLGPGWGQAEARAPAALVAAGAALLLLWLGGAWAWGRRRVGPLPAGLNLLAATLVVLLLQGPWYVMRMGQLRERLTLEQGMYAGRGGRVAWEESLDLLAQLVPGWPLWGTVAAVGLVVGASRTRRLRRVGVAGAALAGLGVGFVVIVKTLPFDPRYLLPLLPLAAISVAAGWEGLGRLRWLATLLLAGFMLRLGVVPLWDTTAVGRSPRPGDAVNVELLAGVPVPVLARNHAWKGRADGVAALAGAARAACTGSPCRLGFLGHPDATLQGRGLAALVRYAGTYVIVDEGAQAAPPRVVLTCTSRPAENRAAAAQPGCGEAYAVSAGCAARLCGASGGP